MTPTRLAGSMFWVIFSANACSAEGSDHSSRACDGAASCSMEASSTTGTGATSSGDTAMDASTGGVSNGGSTGPGTGGASSGAGGIGGAQDGGAAGGGANDAAGCGGTSADGGTAADVYHAMGRYLYDPCGERIVVRGVEQMFWNTSWISPSFVDEIAKTGANTIRILPQIDPPTPDGQSVIPLDGVEQLIQKALDGKMLVDVAVNGGKDPNVYVRDDVKTLLLAHERNLVIHAKGESYESTAEEWATDSKNVVTMLRAAGYRAPLYILATNGGRNLPVILDKGQEILDADPLKNVVFGWQAYWGDSNYYQNLFGMTLAEAVAQAGAAPFVIQVGLLRTTDPNETMAYSAVMADAQAQELGWLWWDWRMSTDNLTTDGTYGHWASVGEDVAVSNVNSIQNTAVKTFFQLNGACQYSASP